MNGSQVSLGLKSTARLRPLSEATNDGNTA